MEDRLGPDVEQEEMEGTRLTPGVRLGQLD